MIGITLKSVVKELDFLLDSKVDSIHEPDKNTIVLGLYNGNNYALNINVSTDNYCVYLTTHKKINPLNAPNFCMLLRKHLLSSRIKKIYVKELERICYIDFLCTDNSIKTLIVELMGRYSNIILVDENFVIIDALKRFNNIDSERIIFPSNRYITPKNLKQDFLSTSIEDFCNIKECENNSLDSFISNKYLGISKTFINCIQQTMHITNTLSEKSLKVIYSYINKILQDSNQICVEYKNGYSIIQGEKDSNLQINDYLDIYYYKKEKLQNFENYKNNLLRVLELHLDKLSKRIRNINKKLDDCRDIDKYKLYGELITSNIYKFNKRVTSPFIEVLNYYDNSTIKIPIDIKFSLSDNAQKYYKKYNKLKNALLIVSKQKEETLKELSYLESLIYSLDNCETIGDLDEISNEITENLVNIRINKKQSKKATTSTIDNYLKFNIDNCNVYVGKNNKQNDYLTTKVANKSDYWFHTKDIHGSHVILVCNGKTPKNETFVKCCELAAYYSKAKYSTNVLVDYCLVSNVKKPKNSVPGFVIYTNNKTLRVNPKSKIES